MFCLPEDCVHLKITMTSWAQHLLVARPTPSHVAAATALPLPVRVCVTVGNVTCLLTRLSTVSTLHCEDCDADSILGFIPFVYFV